MIGFGVLASYIGIMAWVGGFPVGAYVLLIGKIIFFSVIRFK